VTSDRWVRVDIIYNMRQTIQLFVDRKRNLKAGEYSFQPNLFEENFMQSQMKYRTLSVKIIRGDIIKRCILSDSSGHRFVGVLHV